MKAFPYITSLVFYIPIAINTIAGADTLYPKQLEAIKGAFSDDQSIKVLSKLDQTGNEDDWYRYIEVKPDHEKFKGLLKFNYEEYDKNCEIKELRVTLNTLGEPLEQQKQVVSIKNFNSDGWHRLGINQDANSWAWFKHSYVLNDNVNHYINDDGMVEVMFHTNNDYDVVNIDYAAIQLQPSTDCDDNPTPTPNPDPKPNPGTKKMTLNEAKYWVYKIQHISKKEHELVNSLFDVYVLEVTTTEQGMEDYDISGLVQRIKQHNIKKRGVEPLVLAYIDIAQAEQWRWYHKTSADKNMINRLSVGDDPNGWEDITVVKFWEKAWEDIAIYGYKGRSHVQETLKHSFDGIYMDWVEAFSDDRIVNIVGNKSASASRMFQFIEKIRNYARSPATPNHNPNYLIVAQNASDLYEEDRSRYLGVMDAIAVEAIWYDGDRGFDDWNEDRGYNVPTNDLYPGWTEEVEEDLADMKGSLPIFCAEYAQGNLAKKVYTKLAPNVCIPYATRRSLGEISKDLPQGYIDRINQHNN
ncbi:endo alpha-1,4 polygalactosaminidase [Endozoicomonas sp. SM1973]|uniref:Endo alpha-1,4 polygalactosaminidase n=1 Tax=Spartinivicinus marinus TaxID=2994442 RepID=A0A853IJD2_9GAMM|nr:endo alpha-1,4 polygalactosaminidase [Spartinivicinus marinus]MCX4026825.1 endo alpha-1,4 polygalactosaminidase [Spartinivicinus marinus]NYZ69507.1 endo alpha-1,4 polygalactosaminidase [Spartinivicinus marinus]